jgi:hypothetical protein
MMQKILLHVRNFKDSGNLKPFLQKVLPNFARQEKKEKLVLFK